MEVTSTVAAVAAATVSYVSPQVDPKTGLALVRVAVPAGAGLRSGEFVRLRIVSEILPDRLVVLKRERSPGRVQPVNPHVYRIAV